MQLFTVAGIRVGVDWTWLLALGYVVLTQSDNYEAMLGPDSSQLAFGYAVAIAFAFFGSIILHEFGHAIVARRNGIGVLGIDLWLLGGLAHLDREPDRPGVEFRVSAAGPLVTLLIAVGCLATAFAVDPDQALRLAQFKYDASDEAWLAALTSVGVVNVFLLAFNLLPAFPLDGGRIARAIAWKVTGSAERGLRFAAHLGRVLGYGLVGVGLLLLSVAPISAVIFGLMGFSIAQSSSRVLRRRESLGGIVDAVAGDVMDREPVVIDAEITVDTAFDQFFWRYRWPWFSVVDRDGGFLGLLEQHSIEGVAEIDRAGTSVRGLITAGSDRDLAIDERTPITSVLGNPTLQRFGALFVVDQSRRLVGVITIERAQRALRDSIERAAAAQPGNTRDR